MNISKKKIFIESRIHMDDSIRKLVRLLTEQNKTIATMESCTGGAVASAITDFPGASEVLKFSAVTYATEYKIKMGVNPDIIEKYTVYSMETAHSMAYHIAMTANSDYGIGITGKLNDQENVLPTKDNRVDISIYVKEEDTYRDITLTVTEDTRRKNKKAIIELIVQQLLKLVENG